MKKLLLVRHARATHETGFVDFERPLQYEGLQDSAIMAGRVHEHNLIPQLLVSSPALRALTTANIFAEHLSLPQPDTDKSIYDATQETLVTVVNGLPDSHDFIGLFGHNPGFSQLLYYLTGEVREMETCATVLIEFEVAEWGAIGNNSGKITYYSSPR
ncbi:MAG TPA: histidine phosphatase family protein [Mucilaginibacter sp.]